MNEKLELLRIARLKREQSLVGNQPVVPLLPKIEHVKQPKRGLICSSPKGRRLLTKRKMRKQARSSRSRNRC